MRISSLDLELRHSERRTKTLCRS